MLLCSAVPLACWGAAADSRGPELQEGGQVTSEQRRWELQGEHKGRQR